MSKTNKKERFKTLKIIVKTTAIISCLLVTLLFSLGFFNDIVKYKDYSVTKVFEITDRGYSTVTLKSGKEQFTVNSDRLGGTATSSNVVAMAMDKNGYPVAPRDVILKKLQFDVLLIGICVVATLIIVALIKREGVFIDYDEDDKE